MNVAVIGCGQIADIHIAEIQKIDDVKLVAVCDVNELMAEQAAVRFAVPKFYTDAQRLLQEERPSVVHITTPPQSHLALGKLAVAHGAHAYIEKPFAMNAAEASELVACATAAGKQLCVGHSLIKDAAMIEARRLFDANALGELVHIDSTYGYSLKGSFGRLLFEKPKHWIHKLPGRLIQNVIDHAVYPVTHFLPDAAPAVYAQGFSLRQQRYGDVRDEFHDELRVLIRGRHCTANLLFSCQIQPIQHYVRLYGTAATVHLDFHARSLGFERVMALPGALGRLALPFRRATDEFRHGLKNVRRFMQSDLQYNDGLNRVFRELYAAVREGKPSPIPMEDAIRVTRIVDEIIRQAQP